MDSVFQFSFQFSVSKQKIYEKCSVLIIMSCHFAVHCQTIQPVLAYDAVILVPYYLFYINYSTLNLQVGFN